MQNFELVSENKPSGDQPKAIESLIRGLEKGLKHQTLLGVTGSGKSVTGDTDVFIKRNGVISISKIGEIIDQLLSSNKENVKKMGDTEILNQAENNYEMEAYSFDPVMKKNAWKKVGQCVRHKSPTLYEVVTRCGRSITVTGDHNFYVLRNGVLALAETADIKTSDYLPIPRHLPEPRNFISSIEFLKYVSNPEKIFVYLPSPPVNRGNYKKKMYSLFGSSKAWRVLKKGERLNMTNYITLASFLPDVGRKAEFGYKIKNYQFAYSQYLTPLFLKFLGYYIAEGHATAGYLILSSGDKEIISDIHQFCRQYDFHIRLRPHSYDYQISSKVWAEVMKNMCGSHSQTKKLPDFWPQLSNKQLGLLLSAYFSGDGGVDGDQVTCTTASRQLASDIQYSLLRFGIISRLRKRNMKVPNKNYKNEYWMIAISGQKDLKLFRENMGFAVEKKDRKLAEILGKDANTNIDLIPISPLWLKKTRTRCSLSQSDMATLALVNRSYISMLESGKRKPSREVFGRIIEGFKEKTKAGKDQSLYGEIIEQERLLLVFWSPVKSVRTTHKHEYVYDFSVSDTETFLAGSGGIFVHNTFSVANVIAVAQKPTLVIAHNKTLAAQLTNEFRELFPKNSVNYFVSYYDYYQPEAYIPSSDTYIDKEALINDEIDKLRHAATMALLTRKDVIVVASVSCIYGLGAPEAYAENIFHFKIGDKIDRKSFMRKLIELQFSRTNSDLTRGTYRLRGDNWEIMPPDREVIYNFELKDSSVSRRADGEKVISKIYEVDPVEGFAPGKTPSVQEIYIAPAKHFITPKEEREQAILAIEAELRERLKYFEKEGKLLEAERLERRTRFDIAMMREIGYCHGIENYSRHLSGRAEGIAPDTLLDYFPRAKDGTPDFLTIIDESHITIPQIQGMYAGDRSRKKTLIEYGFRLPSASDNRPLMFEEFEKRVGKRIYTSATPGPYERKTCGEPMANGKMADGQTVEQIIRPTGLIDPKITIRTARGQVQDLIPRIEERVAKKERVLVTTLTKKMAEELSAYLEERKIKVTYLHSDVKTLDRIRILINLRKGSDAKGGFDVLVGVNLLREGLDLPEVSLVAILDADKEGFLRSETSLVQTIGRAARNVNGEVLMYADQITGSITRAVKETDRRRKIQIAYNAEHGITPKTIIRKISSILPDIDEVLKLEMKPVPKSKSALDKLISQKTREMKEAATHLDFELAAILRDEIKVLTKEFEKGNLTYPQKKGSRPHNG